MKILLTNDDGYFAPGIRALYEALSTVAELTVVAPDRERSAVGMGITLVDPLRVSTFSENGMSGFKVNGTPVDCVKIALAELVESKPDFIFSGFNSGSNTGINSNYSGTVSAAAEGALNEIQSVAVSLASFTSGDFRVCQKTALRVLELVQNEPLNPFEFLNVNVPPLAPDEIKGMRVTRVSLSGYREEFEKRLDTRRQEYYWMGGTREDFRVVEDGDHLVSEAGYVTVTPLKVDMTSEEAVKRLRANGWESDWNGGSK